MYHAHPHAQTRNRERRAQLAHEAARLMAESGISDFHQAKLKAAQRLGIHDDASLPANREIEAALREYQRLFLGPGQEHALRIRRQAAVRAMEFFASFQPRLVGPVLEGTADSSSVVQLHLHCEDSDAVARFIHEHAIPAQSRQRRLRLDRARNLDTSAWLFSAEELPFELIVLPLQALRQPPLSPLDERPMPRASLAQLRQLIAQEHVADHGQASR